LGAWRNPKLKEINLKAFQQAISICIDEKVDFIAITGDFFDVSVPGLDHVKRAVDIMRVATRQGIEIYMIYGSHDFTAVSVLTDPVVEKDLKMIDRSRWIFEDNSAKAITINNKKMKSDIHVCGISHPRSGCYVL
jgi:DNA repair exonuclease SbcCD nuclease subunit